MIKLMETRKHSARTRSNKSIPVEFLNVDDNLRALALRRADFIDKMPEKTSISFPGFALSKERRPKGDK